MRLISHESLITCSIMQSKTSSKSLHITWLLALFRYPIIKGLCQKINLKVFQSWLSRQTDSEFCAWYKNHQPVLTPYKQNGSSGFKASDLDLISILDCICIEWKTSLGGQTCSESATFRLLMLDMAGKLRFAMLPMHMAKRAIPLFHTNIKSVCCTTLAKRPAQTTRHWRYLPDEEMQNWDEHIAQILCYWDNGSRRNIFALLRQQNILQEVVCWTYCMHCEMSSRSLQYCYCQSDIPNKSSLMIMYAQHKVVWLQHNMTLPWSFPENMVNLVSVEKMEHSNQ